MKVLLKHISLWLLVSVLIWACGTKQKTQPQIQTKPNEMPKPATPNQSKTDSIKHQLDLKRRGL